MREKERSIATNVFVSELNLRLALDTMPTS